MWRADCPQEDGLAIGAPEDDSHWSCIEKQRSYRSDRAARIALNMRSRHVDDKDLLKSACSGGSIEDEA